MRALPRGARVYIKRRRIPPRGVFYDSDRPRLEWEAELREQGDGLRRAVGRVRRASLDDAIAAAHALAERRGWIVEAWRPDWA